MLEKTISNMQLEKTYLAERMIKYQNYAGLSADQKYKDSDKKEECETMVRRRPRKTNKKSRAGSEVREQSETDKWMDEKQRRPLSCISGTQEKEFYIQICKKPVICSTHLNDVLMSITFPRHSLPCPDLSSLAWCGSKVQDCLPGGRRCS